MAYTIADNLIVQGNVTSQGGNTTGSGNQTFGNVTITGTLFQSASNNIVALGTVQANATVLTAQINFIGNVVAGTGVALPLAAAGDSVQVINGNSTTVQVYTSAAGTDTINGITGNLGVALYGGSAATFNPTAAGAWNVTADSGLNSAYIANASSTGFTLSAANITGAASEVVFQNTAASGNITATLPSAAATVLAIQCPSNNTSYALRVINSSASAGNITIGNATGWSLFGNMIVPNGTFRDFILQVTSASGNTTTLRDVGTGTFT